MTKKDYQAIARAIHEQIVASINDPHKTHSRGGLAAAIIDAIADVLAADNPRFDRARFVEACETGQCKGMPR